MFEHPGLQQPVLPPPIGCLICLWMLPSSSMIGLGESEELCIVPYAGGLRHPPGEQLLSCSSIAFWPVHPIVLQPPLQIPCGALRPRWRACPMARGSAALCASVPVPNMCPAPPHPRPTHCCYCSLGCGEEPTRSCRCAPEPGSRGCAVHAGKG